VFDVTVGTPFLFGGRNMRKTVTKEQAFIKNLSSMYLTFLEYIENPARFGAVGILIKTKPGCKEPVKAALLDALKDVDNNLHRAMYRMKQVMGWNKDIPDGLN